MNDPSNPADQAGAAAQTGGGSRMSALFGGLVLNHTQMALLLLGRAPHPTSGETVQDLDGARMLIDQLEMLEQKTRGNLEPHEIQMLRESLTALRMAFVDAANTTSPGAAQPPANAPKPQSEPPSGPAPGGAAPTGPAPSGPAAEVPEEESRKKFTKKY